MKSLFGNIKYTKGEKFMIDFLINLTDIYLKKQKKDGSMIAGNNGAHSDKETPVRNTAHWLISFAKCFQLTNDTKFMKGVKKAANYLLSSELRPYNKNFVFRYSFLKDKCNGLIGPAWIIEALNEAGKMLNNEKYHILAEEIYKLHPFDENYALWKKVEVNGKVMNFDRTFNHQLWFAACSSQILEHVKDKSLIKHQITLFLNKIINNMHLYDDGLIYHHIKQDIPLSPMYKIASYIFSKLKKTNIRLMSIGYHQFNMYAFAMLKENFPQHDLWSDEVIQRIVNFSLSDTYKLGIEREENIYGIPYNSPFFELPYSLSVLSDLTKDKIVKIADYWGKKQIEKTYDNNNIAFTRNNPDPETLTARIYEITRVPIDLISCIKINFMKYKEKNSSEFERS